MRGALVAAASRSPLACEDGTAPVVTIQSAALPDYRSLSGLLNAEEPANLMVCAALVSCQTSEILSSDTSTAALATAMPATGQVETTVADSQLQLLVGQAVSPATATTLTSAHGCAGHDAGGSREEGTGGEARARGEGAVEGGVARRPAAQEVRPAQQPERCSLKWP